MVYTSKHEQTLEHQFDSFCKTVLRNQARDIYDANKRINDRCISLDLLSPEEIFQLSIYDEHDSDFICINLYGYNIKIGDILVAQAIENLSKRKQDIILLSFFLNMSNTDIASLMCLAESTVHYHKTNALKEMKNFMEEHLDEKE